MSKNPIKTVSLGRFKENPDNPQTISAEAWAKLLASIRDHEGLLEYRQILHEPDGTVVCGNKRLRALKSIHGDDGEVPASYFVDLGAMPDEERKALMLRDNVQSGEWDVDRLLSQFDQSELDEVIDLDALLKSRESSPDRTEFDDESTFDDRALIEHRMRIDKIEIPLTDEEYAGISARLDAYVDREGCKYGFVKDLLG